MMLQTSYTRQFAARGMRTAQTASQKVFQAISLRPSSLRTMRMKSTTAAPLRSFPALFVRGGTSNGLVIMRNALPQDQEQWSTILPAAMGSPDPIYARQLNGMGGGISSTSKICVLSKSERPDVDVDFTFVQVGIRDGVLDLAGNCGNMSSAVGPMAWDEGLVDDIQNKVEKRGGGGSYKEATVRFFNTNTSKVVHSRFRVSGDPPRYCPEGDYEMDGVPGTQSCITLSFLDPAGAKTGRALPTGNAVDVLELPDEVGGCSVPASLVDVSNPGVFVKISDLGLETAGKAITPQTFTPAAVDADAALKKRLEAIRQAGAAKMGLDPKTESVPKIVMLFDSYSADEGVDVQCLALSMGQPHKAVPLTLALCLGAAANIPGTLAAQVCRRQDDSGEIKSNNNNNNNNNNSIVIGHPSGKVEIGATMKDGAIVSADLLRTARVLMKGDVYY